MYFCFLLFLLFVVVSPEVGDAIEGTGCLFETPPTPVMCAVDPDDNCWVATDSSGSITKIPKNAQSTADILKLPMPVEYAFLNQTGPGIMVRSIVKKKKTYSTLPA